MLDIVLSEDFNLATKIVVGALYKLKLTLVSMTIMMLPLYALSTSVFAIDNLIQAPFVVRWQIFVDDNSAAFLVRTMDLPKEASQLMRLHFLPLKSDLASLLE